MTDKLREAAQMALDLLGIAVENGTSAWSKKANATKDALRAALAQPEQEPVADKRLKIKLGSQYGSDLCGQWFYLTPADDNASTALTAHTGITAPPQREWQGLTDEELNLLWVNHHGDDCLSDGRILSYERALETKLKEKNSD